MHGISAICMLISYMLRMNMLIFIIALLIYMFMDILSRKIKLRHIVLKIQIILCFIIIVMIPPIIVKNYYCNKCNLDKNKSFPTTGYLFMGMNEGYSAFGWFKFDNAKYAYDDIENSKEIYKKGINERLNYLLKNPRYTLNFYILKTASMWTENTYGGIYYNMIEVESDVKYLSPKIETQLLKSQDFIQIYQKSLIFIIFEASIIVIIQKRKNLSNEIILLLTIFIGGFLFHTMWEAKSRYIIPYIIVLIPIAAIEIDNLKVKNEKLIKKDGEKYEPTK